MMKCVKTACCLSRSMKAFCLLSAWMLKFQRGLSVSKQRTQYGSFSPILATVKKHIGLRSVVRAAAEVLGAEAE